MIHSVPRKKSFGGRSCVAQSVKGTGQEIPGWNRPRLQELRLFPTNKEMHATKKSLFTLYSTHCLTNKENRIDFPLQHISLRRKNRNQRTQKHTKKTP